MTKIERATTGDRERSEMLAHIPDADRQLKPPKLVAWLAALATLGTILVPQFLTRGDNADLRGAGVLLLALAAVLIFPPFFLLRKHGRIEDGETYMQTRAVVDQGSYSIIRHPQYLGYMFLACGFALLSQHTLAVLLAAAAVTLFYVQAVQEEAYCIARLGEPYQHYLQRVPRFNLVLGLLRLWRRRHHRVVCETEED
jgi:protein-S-isoprenylcysteine O-methyltransferase Ste14